MLVVHEWWGLNDFAKKRAENWRSWATWPCPDMYGKGVVTKDPQEAGELAGSLRGTPLLRQRALAGLEVLKQNKLVDPKRLAAIGFCFGGTTVLELATPARTWRAWSASTAASPLSNPKSAEPQGQNPGAPRGRRPPFKA